MFSPPRFALAVGLFLCLALSVPACAQQASPPPKDATTADDLDVPEATPPEATPPNGVPPTDADIPDAVPPTDADIPDAVPPAAGETPPQPLIRASDALPDDMSAANPAPADPSLLPVYKLFGEEPGLVALMDDFMALLLTDKRTKPFFENADQKSVKKHLVEQFCVILGGPCTYTGRDMKTVHAGLGITRSNFNALVEDLQITMTKHHIPYHAQNKLLAKLAPMHREIETK
jgi:hemoglobin